MSIFVNIQHLRQEYKAATLEEDKVAKNPMEQFATWFEDARKEKREANAMTLITATVEGKPSARTLLLKSFDERGFSFFSNYNSRKGQEITANPQACMLFFWDNLERQVNIEGSIEKLSKEESENYFRSRPRDSKIGAWVSMQDRILSGKEELQNALKEQEKHFEGIDEIPMPDYWGGYLLRPNKIEFWQGRPARLHDRLVYYLQEDFSWTIKRLSP